MNTDLGNFIEIKNGDFIMGNSQTFMTKFGNDRSEHTQAKLEHKVKISKDFAVLEAPVTSKLFNHFLTDSKLNNYSILKEMVSCISNKNDLSEYCNSDKTEFEFIINWEKLSFEEINHKLSNQKPVVGVNHQDCVLFCEWASKVLNTNCRLLTEAEWEYVYRGGSSTTFFWGNDTTLTNEYCWYCENSFLEIKPIKTKSPNILGLYDMGGNVWEWCTDFYDEHFYKSSTVVDPVCLNHILQKKVIRGGSVFNKAETCRASHRWGIDPKSRNEFLGFRILMELNQKSR